MIGCTRSWRRHLRWLTDDAGVTGSCHPAVHGARARGDPFGHRDYIRRPTRLKTTWSRGALSAAANSNRGGQNRRARRQDYRLATVRPRSRLWGGRIADCRLTMGN